MADSEYDYTMIAVAIDSLTLQIQQSSIVTALDYINVYGTAVSIFFKAPLSTADQTTLNAVVAAHNGVPLPSNQVQNVSVSNAITTQFERTDINLKIAKVKATVTNGVATINILVPGAFGSGVGRYLAGGYAMIDTFDPDDFLMVSCADNDRNICAALGLATDGTADATVRSMGVLPGALSAFGALPNYPLIKGYTDTGVPTANQGWYFYPLVMGNNLPPMGEIEVEPLGWYGQLPAGLYAVFTVTRPNVQTGTLRGNIFWGDSGIN
jgi:hypothetical protein